MSNCRRHDDEKGDMRDIDHFIQVAVAVFILKGRSILLGKRLSRIGKGTFALPGGSMNYGEDFSKCASREVLEETGLIINDVKVLNVVNTIHDKFPWKPHFVTVIVSAKLSDIVKQTPVNKEVDKCEGWRWYNWGQLPKPLFGPLQELLSTGFNPFEGPQFQQQTQQTATGTQTQQTATGTQTQQTATGTQTQQTAAGTQKLQTQQTATGYDYYGQQQQPQHQPDGGSAAFAGQLPPNYRLQWPYGNPVYYQPAFAGQLPPNYRLQWPYGNPVYYQPTYGQQQGYGQDGYYGGYPAQHAYAQPASTTQYGYYLQQGSGSNPAYPPQDGSAKQDEI